MTAPATDDLEVRVGQWVPTLLFCLGVYAEDQAAVLAMLEPGMPLFEASPIDLTLAWLAVVDMVASIGDVGPDEIRSLLETVGAALQEPPTTMEAP